MTAKLKDQMKETIVIALKNEYGFAPYKSEIVLLEMSGDRTYARFSIRGVVYQFNSHIVHFGDGQLGSVWCGKGTITKEQEED